MGIAIILIVVCVGLPAVYRRWMDTRTFVAIDQPASFSRGHIKTADFEVNLDGWYQIGIELDDKFGYTPDCGLGGSDPLLKAHSIIYRGGRPVDQTDGADRFLGHFYAEKQRRYSLDVEVLTDAGCLNGGHPRLFVWTPSIAYENVSDDLRALSFLLFLAGVGILGFSITVKCSTGAAAREDLAISQTTGSVYRPVRRKLPLRARFSRPPAFGLLYALILLSVALPCFLLIVSEEYRSIGIEVHLSKSAPLRTTENSWAPAPIVRIEHGDVQSASRVYVHSRRVSWEALEGSLKVELKTRDDWVVYVEADDDASWGDVLNAMDIAHGLGAQIVLVTKQRPASGTRSHPME